MATAATELARSRKKRYVVVHESPGRVRLRVEPWSVHEARALAAAIALHPATTDVRWVAAARSMTVRHDPRVPVNGILASASAPRVAAVMLERRRAGGGPVALIGLLPAFGGGGLLARAVAAILAPPASEVICRV